MTTEIEAFPLEDHGDERGGSWNVGERIDFLEQVADIHLTTLKPGHVRGNHFHENKREILIVQHESDWALHWDNGPGTGRQKRDFPGAGAVVVLVPPGCSHAVENRGPGELRVSGLSSQPFDPKAPDAHPRNVLS